MARHHREPRHRATAAEDVGRVSAERVQEGADVVGPQLGGGVLLGVVEGAARDAPWVVGYDRVVAGERAGQRRESGGGHPARP